MVCSYLSPAAVGPLGTWARFTGPLLIRFDPLYTVTGGVSVFILTHHHSPLGPSGTGTRTLSTHNSRFIFTSLAFCTHTDQLAERPVTNDRDCLQVFIHSGGR